MENIEKFRVPEELGQQPAEEPADIEMPPEEDPLLDKEQGEFIKVLNVVNKVDEKIKNQEGIPKVVSEQEQRDIEMSTSHSGWLEYWEKRLMPEMESLPPKMQSILKKLSGNEILYHYQRDYLQKYVSRRRTVLKLHVMKGLAMASLKKELKDIDAQIDYTEEEKSRRQTVFYDESKNELFIEEKGARKPVIFGDIAADYEWGVEYRPDDAMPEKIWRKIRKITALIKARHKIEKIFNNELSVLEHIRKPTTTWSEETLEHLASDPATEGVIAERMAKTFLMRVQYNNVELGLQVEPSNIFEEAILKYDFKVVVPEKQRGVAVEGEEMTRKEFVENKRRFGVQFTVGAGKKKRKQIREAKKLIHASSYERFVKKPVDDIVLVKLPLGTYREHFKQWIEAGKPAGGPEQFLSREEKIKILKAVTRNIESFSDEEIEKLVI